LDDAVALRFQDVGERRVNVNVPSGVTRPPGDNGAVTMRETGCAGAVTISGEANVEPLSVPASHGTRSIVIVPPVRRRDLVPSSASESFLTSHPPTR